MSLSLREEDRQAVDLLLDHALSAVQHGAITHVGASNKHVVSVERVLSLLDAMPAGDPPADLVQRTLDRVEANSASPMRNVATSPSLIDANRPVA
jgi:hypothetical protein